jgi:diaminopimelate epimerase
MHTLIVDRYHGLGNDYLVAAEGPAMTADFARAVCDRHRGVGSDGVLEPADPGPADYGVRIWNPDGSIAEKSGNGLRIFAQWLVDVRNAPRRFSVWTGVCLVHCDVGDDVIAVDMGHASFVPTDVPVIADAPLLDGALPGGPWKVCAVGLGNPHCVVFVDDPDAVPWRAWGAALEVHPSFPNRTNVQIAAVTGPASVDVRVWERGAGETAASGSSACAVASAAVRTGRLAPGKIMVTMPGGALSVDVGPEYALRLVGPVERVGRVVVDADWVKRRLGAA